jgi:hypothetical protein
VPALLSPAITASARSGATRPTLRAVAGRGRALRADARGRTGGGYETGCDAGRDVRVTSAVDEVPSRV